MQPDFQELKTRLRSLPIQGEPLQWELQHGQEVGPLRMPIRDSAGIVPDPTSDRYETYHAEHSGHFILERRVYDAHSDCSIAMDMHKGALVISYLEKSRLYSKYVVIRTDVDVYLSFLVTVYRLLLNGCPATLPRPDGSKLKPLQ